MRDATQTSSSLSIVYKFQSTRPMRDATVNTACVGFSLSISIHASHAGRDRGNTYREL